MSEQKAESCVTIPKKDRKSVTLSGVGKSVIAERSLGSGLYL